MFRTFSPKTFRLVFLKFQWNFQFAGLYSQAIIWSAATVSRVATLAATLVAIVATLAARFGGEPWHQRRYLAGGWTVVPSSIWLFYPAIATS